MSASLVDEAVERVAGRQDAPIAISCEHASQRLPSPWRWPESDQRLVDTHWAYDLGAREIVLELAQGLGAPAVLSRFSRLLADPNREEHHPDLFRRRAEGEPVALNREVSADEAQRRLEACYRPYHAAFDAMLGDCGAPMVFSVHTFTPEYEGQVRDVKLGVLFNLDEPQARALGEHLAGHLDGVRYNEPWSGKVGLIYAPERHAEHHGRRALEIEVRQDLATDPAYRARLVPLLIRFFEGYPG